MTRSHLREQIEKYYSRTKSLKAHQGGASGADLFRNVTKSVEFRWILHYLLTVLQTKAEYI